MAAGACARWRAGAVAVGNANNPRNFRCPVQRAELHMYSTRATGVLDKGVDDMNANKNVGGALLSVLLLAATSVSAQGGYRNCDDDRINTIVAAAYTAQLRLMGAGQDLANIRNGGDASRFETWFGPATSEHVDDVQAVLYAAWQGGMANATYLCGQSLGCSDPSAIAWSEHGSALGDSPTYGVYICDPFWDLGNIDQADALIHEYTHLYGTRDFTAEENTLGNTWQDVAKAVAQRDPDAAISIAYNFGFYCTE
jgi:hypothetical protein